MSLPKKIQIYFYRVLYNVQVMRAPGTIEEYTGADEIAVDLPLRHREQFANIEKAIGDNTKATNNSNGAALLGLPKPRVVILNFWLLRTEKVPYEAWAASRTMPNGEVPEPPPQSEDEAPPAEAPVAPEGEPAPEAPSSIITTD